MNLIESTILLVGAGQLGSRYLQGLVNCRIPLKIYVYDICVESLSLAKERWNEVLPAAAAHEIEFTSTLDAVR